MTENNQDQQVIVMEEKRQDLNSRLNMVTDVAIIKTQVEQILKDITELKNNFVTIKEFLPVRIIAYGFVGLVMSSVVFALIALVVRKGS